MRMFSVLLLLSTFISCRPSAPAEEADLVLRNGKILTMESANPEAEALAITGETILAVGTNDEVEAYVGAQTEVIDLGGALAVPGLIDGHGHFMSLGDSLMGLDLRNPRTWDEIVGRVAEAARSAKPGEWILGRGWHQEKWDAEPTPTVDGYPVHDRLSQAAPDNPVILQHASGHASIVNARAAPRCPSPN